jgi:hypothetical protein
MNLDRRIIALVRQGPAAVSLPHLCLLMFPTFSWAEMALVVPLVRWRCHALIEEGRLAEVNEELFIATRPGMRRVARA